MKKLIINADDFGLCESVNKGILESIQHGIVSDFSFMINVAEFPKSHEALSDANIKKIGYHLNFTVGESLLGLKSKMVNKEGKYFDFKTLMLKIVFGSITLDDITNEIGTQIKFLLDHGYSITHIDSHQNIHLIPQIMKPLIKLRNEFAPNVPIRMPLEKMRYISNLKTINFYRILILNLLTFYSQTITNYRNSIKTIGGNFFHNNENENVFFNILENIEKSTDRVFELAVHPGYLSNELEIYDSYIEPRIWELKLLKDENILQNSDSIKICSFNEI
jgi:predicted glycoside hydrolase/deacetylase ChbG (UPF0249 family)